MEQEHVVLQLSTYMDLQRRINNQERIIESSQSYSAGLTAQRALFLKLLKAVLREDYYTKELRERLKSPNTTRSTIDYYAEQVLKYGVLCQENTGLGKEEYAILNPLIEEMVQDIIFDLTSTIAAEKPKAEEQK